ncbi:MAG TPA: peptidoglycan-binding protein [Devosia sp.]|nr:peptidoglycan-binding protein [Devosia sp.]
MARASQQSQPYESDRDNSGEWQSLRQELVALLDQVDSQVARSRGSSGLSERVRDMRFRVTEQETDNRHRDALRSVQRAINRFEDAVPSRQMQPNPRDSLQAAIDQIRARQDNRPSAPPPPTPASRLVDPTPLFERLAQSVGGLGSRLEKLEAEIKAQIRTGANVKDVADQVAQLAHVVELLAGAVGETGQVKRLEGQIASLGKIISQGREMDIQSLTRRLDDVAATVGKLAELQVHYADRVQNPVETQAFQDGMRSIEESVRAVYDRIDSLERQRTLSPEDLDHVTSEMARFTEAIREGEKAPQHLVELIDALNTRISDLESGDRLLHGLRKDLGALRDAVIVSLTPRFDAIEERMGTLSTRDDMAEIGRQIGLLSERMEMRGGDPGVLQLEAQVRQLVARMDQTGEQLSGLARLYSEPTTVQMPDFDAMADMFASRAAEAVQRQAPAAVDTSAVATTIESLEARIAGMLEGMRRDPEVDAFDSVQAGINEVNARLERLEASLLARGSTAPEESGPRPSEDVLSRAMPTEIRSEPVVPAPGTPQRSDAMARNPAEDAPLIAPPFPPPVPGPVGEALEARARRRHPGLVDDMASRYDRPAPPAPPPGFEPDKTAAPPAPQPSPGFGQADAGRAASEPFAPVAASSRNTFIEAARRAAQRQSPPPLDMGSNSLIGRALARFHTGDGHPSPMAKVTPEPAPPMADRSQGRKATAAPSPTPEPAPALDPVQAEAKPTDNKESFLSRNRKTILLAAAVVALAFLTLNLVAQRLNHAAPPPKPAPVAAPATTGDISGDVKSAAPILDSATSSLPPRVIPMVDSLKTGSISATPQGFSAAPSQPMPSAFTPASEEPAAQNEVAAIAPDTATPAVAPLTPVASPVPVKVDPPPETIGSADLRQAAANGDPRAQFEVAAIYTEGRAVPQDYKAAATWYEYAAKQGFAPAEYRLGSLYENGSGVTKDLETARFWYEKAAEAGNRMSMHNLAALYAGGQLGKQQFDSAAKWFEQAARLGLTDSQFNLGMLYARGLGVPQSLQDSFRWFGIAALSGDKDAAKARDDIARSLDAETVAKLTAEINSFKPAPIDLKANFAPIGTWTKNFDPGETITTRDIVASVQKALGKLGYDVGTPDGIAGKKTSDAIKAFEAGTGMNEVGQVNPRLLAVLGSQPV